MTSWQGKKVLVIGAARQGLSAARYLAKRHAHVVLNDARPIEEFNGIVNQFEYLPIDLHFGGHPIRLLKDVDVVCVSGGVPLSLPIIQQALKVNLPLTNDSQIFLETVQARVIGITGSAGKTTTTVLVGAIAKADARPDQTVWVGGNIGDPLLNYLDEIRPNDWVIMELSSFQLEQMTVSPSIAVVLNITPNHLDRHGNMAAYTTAKSRILTFQNPTGIAVLNRDDAGSAQLESQVAGKLITFGTKHPKTKPGVFLSGNEIVFWNGDKSSPLATREILQLPGTHNLCNALAACAAGVAAGFSPEAMRAGIHSVKGIPHRLELVRETGGVRWVNDSIATTPERVIAAIHAVNSPLVLLLGGRDKNLPWQSLVKLMHTEKPKTVLFGEAAALIKQAIMQYENSSPAYPLFTTRSLAEAFQKAVAIAKPGETVLLSPGGTSFDAYRDFEERGEHFRRMVEEIA